MQTRTTCLSGFWAGVALVVAGFIGHHQRSGLVGSARAAPGDPVTCAPQEDFCDGTLLLTCTYAGTDATLRQDCSAGGTATNPGSCATADCGTHKACCGRQKNTAEWSFTAPAGFSGHVNTGLEGQGTADLAASCGFVGSSVQMYEPNIPVCSPSVFTAVSLNMNKAGGFAPGQTVTLPDANVSLTGWQPISGVVTRCDGFTGSVTWVSADPTAKVTLNATCSDVGKSAIKFIGSISGNR